MVRVKICGITNLADARRSVDAGADALGFNFYAKSPRYIAPAEARAIAQRLPRHILTVGVFVNAPVAAILKIALAAELNVLQLHGDESPALVRKLRVRYPVVKAFRVGEGFTLAQLKRFQSADAFLLDAFDPGLRGGTGKTFDWRVARAARKYGPIVLAGGLTPENIAEAIAKTEPFAVDVCSGVEKSPGKKDAARLKALMAAIERAKRARKYER
jgi:phosphoribosylanthranilate isomerase